MSGGFDWPRVRRRVFGVKGHLCYWCGRKLVNFSDIQDSKRIKLKKHKVVWRGDHKIKEGWLATVDHVRPRSQGGKDKLDNLVPSCHQCNNIRSRFSDPGFMHKSPEKRKKFILDTWTLRVRSWWLSTGCTRIVN